MYQECLLFRLFRCVGGHRRCWVLALPFYLDGRLIIVAYHALLKRVRFSRNAIIPLGVR